MHFKTTFLALLREHFLAPITAASWDGTSTPTTLSNMISKVSSFSSSSINSELQKKSGAVSIIVTTESVLTSSPSLVLVRTPVLCQSSAWFAVIQPINKDWIFEIPVPSDKLWNKTQKFSEMLIPQLAGKLFVIKRRSIHAFGQSRSKKSFPLFGN